MNIQNDLQRFFSATGMTQKELSKKSAVSQSTISKVLRGKGCHSSIVEKLWPFIYGDQKPTTKKIKE